MGNVNDPNDPFYSAQAGWIWDPGFNSWLNVGGPNAGGTNAPPQQAQPEMWGNGVQNTTSNADRNDPAGAFKKSRATVAGTPDPNRFDVNPDVASTGADGANWMGQLSAMSGKLGARKAPQLDQSQSDQMRNAQTGLITDLQNQAAGIGPSLAQAQLQKASDQNLANTMASIQSTRGMGATAAAGQAQGAGAQAGQQLAQDSAILRLQEQMQAKGMLGQLATGARGQDLGAAAQNAQLQAQNEQQIAALTMQGIAQGLDYASANRDARMKVAGMNQQGAMQANTLDQQNAQFTRNANAQDRDKGLDFFMNLLKMLAGGAGGATGAGAVTGG